MHTNSYSLRTGKSIKGTNDLSTNALAQFMDSVHKQEKPSTVAPYTPGSPSESPTRVMFRSIGVCAVDGVCITSNGYPANYGSNENCDITPLMSGELMVEDFQTQGGVDKLTIAGVDYSGSSDGPTGVGVDTSTSITWASDVSVENKGFRICLIAAPTISSYTPPSAQPVSDQPWHVPSTSPTVSSPSHLPVVDPQCLIPSNLRGCLRSDPSVQSSCPLPCLRTFCRRRHDDGGLLLLLPGDVQVSLEPAISTDPSLRVAVSVLPPGALPAATGRHHISIGQTVLVQMARNGSALTATPEDAPLRLRILVPEQSPSVLDPWPCDIVVRSFNEASGQWGGARPVSLPGHVNAYVQQYRTSEGNQCAAGIAASRINDMHVEVRSTQLEVIGLFTSGRSSPASADKTTGDSAANTTRGMVNAEIKPYVSVAIAALLFVYWLSLFAGWCWDLRVDKDVTQNVPPRFTDMTGNVPPQFTEMGLEDSPLDATAAVPRSVPAPPPLSMSPPERAADLGDLSTADACATKGETARSAGHSPLCPDAPARAFAVGARVRYIGGTVRGRPKAPIADGCACYSTPSPTPAARRSPIAARRAVRGTGARQRSAMRPYVIQKVTESTYVIQKVLRIWVEPLRFVAIGSQVRPSERLAGKGGGRVTAAGGMSVWLCLLGSGMALSAPLPAATARELQEAGDDASAEAARRELRRIGAQRGGAGSAMQSCK
eukprot:gene57364-biopygen111550